MHAAHDATVSSDRPAALLAAQIVQAAVKPDVTAAELGSLCASDPGFVVRLLSLVNCAAYGVGRRITDAQHAVSLLGVRSLRNLALSLCVSDLTPRGNDGDALLVVCLRRAVAARLLAERMGKRPPEEFFTVGLLLECGLLVRARTDLAAAAEAARAPARARLMYERAAGAAEHPALGVQLAQSLGLAEPMVAAIAHHHDERPPEGELALVGWLAEQVSAVFEGGDVSTGRSLAREAAAAAGLAEGVVDEVLNELPPMLSEAGREFARDVGPLVDIDTLLRDANAALVAMNQNYQQLVTKLERLVQEKQELAQELKNANERLSHMAATDPLTGLANHRAFQDALERDLARADREDTPLTLVLVDADHFKRVNDSYGHPVGDEVLKVIGGILQQAVRASDVAARVGGEEFALILPGTGSQGGRTVAERVRMAIQAANMSSPKGPFRMTASLGLATIQGRGCRALKAKLCDDADRALYASKNGGRNRVTVAR